MNNKLGIFLMEESNGVAVQLFADPAGAEKTFAELRGKPGDMPSRAILVTLDFEAGTVRAFGRKLPIIEAVEDRPDGWRLGEGPIHFSEDTPKLATDDV